MITETEHKIIPEGRLAKLRGLSTDSKPTTLVNGSEFFEIDTGATYFYDEDGEQWVNPLETEGV
jgi:hypothetical protein